MSRVQMRHSLALTMASMPLITGYTTKERNEWVEIVDTGYDDAPARVVAGYGFEGARTREWLDGIEPWIAVHGVD